MTTEKRLSTEEIHRLLAFYIREVFARRRYARVNPMYTTDVEGMFIEFDSEFHVADYIFRVYKNKLIVEKNCKIIGECDTCAELIGWLFELLCYVIDQRQVKEFRRICFNCKL